MQEVKTLLFAFPGWFLNWFPILHYA